MENMKIILDLDGVLIDNLKFEDKVLKTIFKKISQKNEIGLNEAKRLFWEIGKVYEGKREWHDWRIYCKKLRIKNFWKEAHLENLKFLKLVKDARNFLAKLKEDGHTLILASDAIRPVIEIKIKHFKLKDFFSLIISQDETRCIKTDPKYFKYIFRKVGKGKYVILDNRIDRGINTAKALGIITIYLKKKEHSHLYIPLAKHTKPDFIAKNLAQAYNLIKNLSSSI